MAETSSIRSRGAERMKRELEVELRMAQCSTWNTPADGPLFEHDEAASNRLEQRIRRPPRQRRRDRFGGIATSRPPKQKDEPAGSGERLHDEQRSLLNTHSANRDQLVGLMQVGPREQLLEPRRGHVGARHS